MCLTTVDKTPKRTKGRGYKLYNTGPDGQLYSLLYGRDKGHEIGKWYRDYRTVAINNPFGFGPTYPAGIHIHRSKHDAQKWGKHVGRVIARVEYEDVVATGLEHTERTDVARRVRILSTEPWDYRGK
ncbi:hypothetical protein LCGC14_0316070 [marine sediment metagenome]|uniref:Uncharacterized protein n=1 Tax=marine sediment metagenome TaxID=412755 RepID=A0A0F9TKB6_9ZZZZ